MRLAPRLRSAEYLGAPNFTNEANCSDSNLDVAIVSRKSGAVMRNAPSLLLRAAPIAAILLLAACNSEPDTVTGGTADPDAAKVAAAPPVELPPMVTASRTYRCKDNSLVYIDFFNNGTAVYRTEKEGAPAATLASVEEGKPYTFDGYSVSSSGTHISLTAPGKGTTTCKA